MGDATDAELLQAKRELARIRAQVERLNLGVRMRQLLPIDEVRGAIGSAIRTHRARLEAALRRCTAELAPGCKGGAPFVHERLMAAFDDLCEDFAQGMVRGRPDA